MVQLQDWSQFGSLDSSEGTSEETSLIDLCAEWVHDFYELSGLSYLAVWSPVGFDK